MDNPLEARSPPSPPPAQLDDEALRPLPSLPTEIMQRIIQLSLPRLSFKTFRERFNTLLNLCRVNKLWAALAQEELYRHVGIGSKATAESFITATRAANDAGRRQTRSLRLLLPDLDAFEEGSTLQRAEMQQVETLLAMLPMLRMLCVVAEEQPHPVLDLGALSALAPNLEDLIIDYFDFDPSPSQSPLLGAHLRRLTLSFVRGPAEIASVLASADLPLLQTLILSFSHGDSNPGEVEALEAVLLRYGTRLKAFALSFVNLQPAFELSSNVWSSFTVLRTLTLDHNSPLDIILPLLSAPLTRLRLRPPFHPQESTVSFDKLQDSIRNSPACLGTLSQIVIPPAELEQTEGRQAARHSLNELCQSRGIEVSERPCYEPSDCIAFLEDALDAW
ncbi:hypothetical protein BCR35DRAFT_298035 [Leucosporidium creatinivorum]|uniref:Uncharacterized protein n=1 Tax=Leucosporidium creatinivorum TaxID=106004 RepID=A0A1Y2G7N5_9BASI|nr:hypothetical protein BCR35DRAFT_298035 [Leucosporidium creatinivorum]